MDRIISTWESHFIFNFILPTAKQPGCKNKKITRKCVNYSDVLPLKAAWRDSISNLTFLGLQILAADEPNTVSSRVAVGRHVNAA